MTTENALALEIAALTKTIKDTQEKLDAKKAELVTQVGDGGAVIETALGKVTITQQTQDRPTGQFSYSLSVETFMTLDERVKANLIKQGVVAQTEKVTKGQAPVVKVSFK